MTLWDEIAERLPAAELDEVRQLAIHVRVESLQLILKH